MFRDTGTAAGDIGDVNARRAIDAPADGPLLALRGPAASGKTETLARRYVDLLGRDPALRLDATIVTAAQPESAAALGTRIAALLPAGRLAELERDGRYFGQPLERLALDMLAEHTTLSGLAYDLETIDAYDAQEIFERAIAPLFSADWNDFLGPDIDAEIPGLRAPDRFAVAALRLIRKLRDAQIGPDAFLSAALHGATTFYANPPNLAAPSLLLATKDEHRSALTVDAGERERQRRRELDLAKLLAKLYRRYIEELVGHGCLTPSDAIAEATRLLGEHPALARSYRGRFRIAVVDDVHDLPTGAFGFLQAIFGKTAAGVTVAGDPNAATLTFAGARPERIFGAAATTLALQANYAVPAQIAAVVRAVLEPQVPVQLPGGDALRVYRAPTAPEEVAFVAAGIAARIAAGTPPERIAVLHRSLRALAPFEDALVDRDIPVALHGDGALFARHDTLDALALLWSTADPFAHAWLLRVLQMPLLALSDAAVATLCGEPASPQAPLFDLPQEETDGSRRWDRRRDLRLGTNVVRGDRDADLDTEARERLVAFRRRRAYWQQYMQSASLPALARVILGAGGMFERRCAETAARMRRRNAIGRALLAVIDRYAERYPGADLAGALQYCERIARSENGPVLGGEEPGAVVVAAIDRMKARRFTDVFVVDVRAGSFPPYYVPDAFLFSPTYGMIAKDSVGDAVTARTAKFTWYAHQAKLRETYAREDRRALAVALARADRSATVTAAGRPTRGIAAPELLAELEALEPSLPCASRLEVAMPAPATLVPDVRPARPAGPPHSAPLPAAGETPRLLSAERLVEMVRCVRCAPQRAFGATLDAALTLLSGRLPARDERLVERDVQFALRLGTFAVFGVVPALVRHDDREYIALASSDEHAAALAIYALRERVADDGYFVESADGTFDGPHLLQLEPHAARLRAAATSETQRYCAEHRTLQ